MVIVTSKFEQLEPPPQDTIEYRKSFLENISKKLGIKTLDDWFSIKSEQFLQSGGSSLLRKYGNSMRRVLEVKYFNLPNY